MYKSANADMMVRRTSPMVGVATAKKAKRLFVLGKSGFSAAGGERGSPNMWIE